MNKLIQGVNDDKTISLCNPILANRHPWQSIGICIAMSNILQIYNVFLYKDLISGWSYATFDSLCESDYFDIHVDDLDEKNNDDVRDRKSVV